MNGGGGGDIGQLSYKELQALALRYHVPGNIKVSCHRLDGDVFQMDHPPIFLSRPRLIPVSLSRSSLSRGNSIELNLPHTAGTTFPMRPIPICDRPVLAREWSCKLGIWEASAGRVFELKTARSRDRCDLRDMLCKRHCYCLAMQLQEGCLVTN